MAVTVATPTRAEESFVRSGRHWDEDISRAVTFLCALLLVIAIVAMFYFIASKGLLIFLVQKVGLGQFFFGTTWIPNRLPRFGGPRFGAAPFILGSLAVTAGATLLSAPVSVIAALFLSEIAPNWARTLFQPAVEVFVGIPSVVYGWVGITVLVPLLRQTFGGVGFSLLAGCIVLSIMILPTITSVSADALRRVPRGLHEGSYGLGATRWQTLWKIAIRAAAPGIAAGVVLGIARAIGEALAVQMVIGNVALIPHSLTLPVSTLTSEITLEMGNTIPGTAWNNSLWTMALVLLVASFALNIFIRWVVHHTQVRS
jgi:phosphate transport system permease protein